jgi:hypothetical protein
MDSCLRLPLATSLIPQYLRLVTVTRRSILTAVAATAAVQAQRNRPPNWKPRLGTLGNYTEANVDFTKAEGFTNGAAP